MLSVWFREELTGIEFKDVGCFVPDMTDRFEGCLPPDGFQVFGEIVGQHESKDMGLQAFQVLVGGTS